ncbi:MAG: prepilin-type N-terminal cleavage/methylation domain-containing protein, partial [Coprobacillus cateniformis]|nr:prepilin-type N-terminal cleavage/methylation domain-containing protein [Coprobacillus cateniformis]
MKKKMKETMNKLAENKKMKGLTLVEILVVILIIGILIVALVPRISSATDKARETQVKTDMRTYALAAESVMREYAGFSGVPLMAKDGSVLG